MSDEAATTTDKTLVMLCALFVWNASEYLGIPLGVFAHLVYGLSIGRKGVKL